MAVGPERKNVLRWYDPVTDWMWEVRPTEGRIQEEAQIPGGGGGGVDCCTATWMEEAGSGRHGVQELLGHWMKSPSQAGVTRAL